MIVTKVDKPMLEHPQTSNKSQQQRQQQQQQKQKQQQQHGEQTYVRTSTDQLPRIPLPALLSETKSRAILILTILVNFYSDISLTLTILVNF